MIKWKCEIKYMEYPTPIDVVSETTHYVTKQYTLWNGETGYEKIKKDGCIFDTFEEAKEALLLNAKIRVSRAEIDLQREKDRLEKIEAINEPENVDVA